MQATLVSHYGEKPFELASYVKRCQKELTGSGASAFTPYEIAQVHGTILGLEGCRRKSRIENTNFLEHRKEIRYMDPFKLIEFLSSPAVPVFDIQIGGYLESNDYGFVSQGKHPYLRSLSIQGDFVVAMGWPSGHTNILDEFRRSFNKLNVVHKWHKTESDIDNDFFFVLGRLNRDLVGANAIAGTESKMRQFMASSDPIIINVNSSSLGIVRYVDTQLPLATSRVHAINDLEFTPDDLLQCYDECNCLAAP